MDVNKGIVVTGSGQLHAGAVAAGDGARAENTTGSSTDPRVDELRAQVTEVIAMMRGMADLHDGEGLVAIAEQTHQELGRDRPNKHILTGLLAILAGGVAKAADLAEAVEKIRHAVSALF
jgi:hypothetical protein